MRNPERSEGGDYNAWDSQAIDDEALPETLETLETLETRETIEALELEVTGAGSALRLDKWLAGHLEQFSRTRLQHWIEAGAVRVNGKAASIRQTVWEGDRVTVMPQRSEEESAFRPEPMELPIVYEDEVVLVLDKPAGIVVHPAPGNWEGTLLNGLLHHLPALASVPRAGIVHRLDKDTSGLMVVAKTLESQTELVRQLQARSVKREYLAVVHGAPPATGTIAVALGRSLRDRKKIAAFTAPHTGTKDAITHYRVIARCSAQGAAPSSLVSCTLETGRTHQIRVHMQWAGFPLYGDPLYGRVRLRDPFPRQALHAWRLGFMHPARQAAVEFLSAPPADLEALLITLGLSEKNVLEQLRRGGEAHAS